LPQSHGGAPARGAAGGDRGDVLSIHAEQAGGAVFGGAGGGRGQDGTGGAAVMGGEPQQPAQHEGHVGAQDAPIGVAFVDDDVAQAAQQPLPAPVAWQQGEVQEVRVGEHHIGPVPYPGAFVGGGVAVAGGRSHVGDPAGGEHPAQAVQLVGGQGFGGAEVEHAGAALQSRDASAGLGGADRADGW